MKKRNETYEKDDIFNTYKMNIYMYNKQNCITLRFMRLKKTHKCVPFI